MTHIPSQRRRIFLMRHGSVSYFDQSGKPVLPESVPLNELGRAQASAAGLAFAATGQRFDRVIASGLPRTVETATRVLAETGQAIEIEIWPALQEIRGGRLSARPAPGCGPHHHHGRAVRAIPKVAIVNSTIVLFIG